MSATVGAALKKIAVSLLTDKKVLKVVGGIVLGIIIIIVMPIVAIVSIFNGTIEFDTAELQQMVEQNLSAEEIAKLQGVEDTMYAIEDAMTAAGYDWQTVREAQVLYVTALYEFSFDSDFVNKLVGCFAPDQTDEQLIAAVNAAFGTDIAVEEFTQLMVGVNQEIVSVAQSQIGNEGGQPYWSWYGFESRVEWCACFVSWCADQCGYIDRGICPKFSLCSDGVNWFQQKNQWLAGTETPSPGMIIFFDWADDGQDGVSDHVGIVASVENGTVHTIEGNSGDACRERSYSVGYYEILGYGVLQVGGETDNSNTETPTQSEDVMDRKRHGILIYDEKSGRYDIRFSLEHYYGGLHCGECFDVFIGSRWVPTRIEMSDRWYLVGVKTDHLAGLRVRM